MTDPREELRLAEELRAAGQGAAHQDVEEARAGERAEEAELASERDARLARASDADRAGMAAIRP